MAKTHRSALIQQAPAGALAGVLGYGAGERMLRSRFGSPFSTSS
jgi:hypothetical protein